MIRLNHRLAGTIRLRLPRTAILPALAVALGCACQPSRVPEAKNDLSQMQTASIRIKDQDFQVWLARTPQEQERGLMQVTEDRLAPLADGRQRGMLFVFSSERILSFWMLNTIIPLDIVYIRGDGQIVRKYTMAPLETRLYSSVEPALMALEVRAGLLDELGIGPGDRVEIPESVLKAVR